MHVSYACYFAEICGGHRHSTKHVYLNVARSTRYVVNRGPRKALEHDRWLDTTIASTASAGALKSGESETTPPIIARLRNVTCPPQLTSHCLVVSGLALDA